MNLVLTLRDGRVLPLDKKPLHLAWDEAEHPRADDGKFTDKSDHAPYVSSHSIDTGGHIEGGDGPERAEWQRLRDISDAKYAEADAAHDAFLPLARAAVDKAIEENDPVLVEAEQKWKDAMAASNFAMQELKAQEPAMRIEVIRNVAATVAEAMGVHPGHFIVMHNDDPKVFEVAGHQMTEAGHFDNKTGAIVLNAATIDYANTDWVKGVAAHEMAHLINYRFEDDVKSYGDNRAVTPEMIAENGHSAYAKRYWMPEAVGTNIGNDYTSAIKETIAEVSRYLVAPQSWKESGHPEPNSKWVALVKDLFARQKADTAYQAAADDPKKFYTEARLDRWEAQMRARGEDPRQNPYNPRSPRYRGEP